jgi:putative ABC transport system substrate-binding protein
MASELVRLKVDIIVAWQTPATAAAKAATREIPIVMAGAADPIGNGFIASHSRPGGNITGMSGAGGEVFGKGVELLREVVPRARRFAVLANAVDPFSPAFERLLETSAHGQGVQLLVNKVHPSDDLRRVFTEFARLRVDGLIIQPSLLSQAVADLALQHRLPSIAGFRAFAENGGLMSYSGNQAEYFEQAARYVDLILRGAKPAALPAAHATKFELVINLKTAKALGIVVPQTLLIRADELIE